LHRRDTPPYGLRAESLEKEQARQAEADQRKRAVASERRARKEADEALAINEFLTKDLLTQAEPANNAAEDKVTLLEVLDRAAGKVGERFSDQPEVGISLRRAIARTYHGLAAWAKAEAQSEAVLEAERKANRESAPSYQAQSELSHILQHRGRYDAETLTMAKEGADGMARTLGNDHPVTLTSMNNLALAYQAAGKLDRALPLFEETVALMKSKLGPDHPDTHQSMNNLAGGYWRAKRLDQSIPLFEECLKLRRVKSGEEHPNTMLVKANLGVNYKDAGRLAEALPLLDEANRAVRKYPTLRWVRRQLLDAYIKGGRNDEAAALAKEMLIEDRAALPAGSPQLAGTLAQVGLSLLKTKNWAEAEAVVREALTIREAREPDDWRTFDTKSRLGGALLGQKKYAQAEPLLKAGYEGMKQRAEKILPQDKLRLGEALDRLIELAEATGNVEDAKM